jgi:hypothetical protein
MLVSREELEEAFTKVIEGKESFRNLEAKLHTKEHASPLLPNLAQQKVEELESHYHELEGEIRG